MVAGSAAPTDVSFAMADGLYQMAGEFSCIEMIGSVRYEKIGDNYGKTNGTDR